MNVDAYYRGTAADRLSELSREMGELAAEAASRGADTAGFVLADVATQLLDMAGDTSGQQAARELS